MFAKMHHIRAAPINTRAVPGNCEFWIKKLCFVHCARRRVGLNARLANDFGQIVS